VIEMRSSEMGKWWKIEGLLGRIVGMLGGVIVKNERKIDRRNMRGSSGDPKNEQTSVILSPLFVNYQPCCLLLGLNPKSLSSMSAPCHKKSLKQARKLVNFR
jgi:hypothetical protein